MEDILIPLFFMASALAFPLLRREMIHRHRLDLLRAHPAPTSTPTPTATPAAELALHLPEPHRHYALALLCRLTDAPTTLDAQAAFVLRQARDVYLPDTLRAYLNLTPEARRSLTARGEPPEDTLRQQLELIHHGVQSALQRDEQSARQLLTQGHFLRERFSRNPPALETHSPQPTDPTIK